jgi:hypothetical protein
MQARKHDALLLSSARVAEEYGKTFHTGRPVHHDILVQMTR